MITLKWHQHCVRNNKTVETTRAKLNWKLLEESYARTQVLLFSTLIWCTHTHTLLLACLHHIFTPTLEKQEHRAHENICFPFLHPL